MIKDGDVSAPERARTAGEAGDLLRAAGLLRRVVDIWHATKPIRPLVLTGFFNLALSAGYIMVFSRRFDFDARLVMLHLTVVAGLIALVIVLGLSVYSRRVRESRAARMLLSLIPATGHVLLVFIYLIDFVSNRFWGSNINYDLAKEFFSHPGQAVQLPISLGVYLSVGTGVTLIYVVYLVLSSRIFASFEEIFLPDRRFSLFRNRQRARKSFAVLGFFLCCYIGLLAISWVLAKRHAELTREPLVGLFMQTESVSDLGHYELKKRLIEDEPRVRAQYPKVQSFDRRNVIIFIVDSMRADHMQVYGYERQNTPFLASLMDSGRLKKVELALSTCSETNCGILSTMASKNFRGLAAEDFKLYDLLHDQGYKVYFIHSQIVSWYGLREQIGDSPDLLFDGTNSARYNLDDDRVIFEGIDKVPRFTGAPAFFYFHLMSVHMGGVKQDLYRRYNPSFQSLDWAALVDGKYDPVALTNNYDNGILQADATIEQVFEALKGKGYMDHSLVIILADHGEGLGERGEYAHIFGLHQELIRIPLLIYDAPEISYGNLKFATQVDVAPTVVDRLGLPIPSSWQGRSLLTPEIKQYSFHETGKNGIRAVVYRTGSAIYKYIQGDKSEELYELVNDPHEERDLMANADPSLVRQLRDKLQEFLLSY
jgi:glucan phosphoethanolaminetransferase (alkaline phosphatase superfamily)